jgi:hypothetical protein
MTQIQPGIGCYIQPYFLPLVIPFLLDKSGEHFDGKSRRRNFPLIQPGDISMEFPTLLKKYNFGANLIFNDIHADKTDSKNNILPPLVMSMALGYSLDRFEAFIGTLRRTGYTGDVSKNGQR